MGAKTVTSSKVSDPKTSNKADSKYFEIAQSRGWMSGEPGTGIHSKAALTRKDLAVILTRALQLPMNSQGSTFQDVKSDGWYRGAIEAVNQAKLMQGDRNHFYPDRAVTREEMAVILMRASQFAEIQKVPQFQYPLDWNSIASWAQASVQSAIQKGFMKTKNTQFLPRASVNREEAAEMIVETFMPINRPAEIQKVLGNQVQINGIRYTMGDRIAPILQDSNAGILQDAGIQFVLKGKEIEKITYLELRSGGENAKPSEAEFKRNIILDGHGATLDGKLEVASDFISVTDLNISGDLRIKSELQNDFYAHQITVQGKTFIEGGDENTVVFDSSDLNDVRVNKTDVHVVASGNTSIEQISLISDASITAGSAASINQLSVDKGATKVSLEGIFPQVVLNNPDPVQISGAATISKLVADGAGNVSIDSTGTIGELAVNNKGAKIEVGANSNVQSITLANGAAITQVSGVNTGSSHVQTAPASNASGNSSNIGNGSNGSVNTPPQLIQPFEDPRLSLLGDAPYTIDLSQFIKDNEQSTIKFSAISMSSKVAKATVAGNMLTITPVGKGSAKISIVADDQNGKTANFSFNVSVNATIPDQTLQLGTGDMILDLNSFFENTDKYPLNYTVSIHDPSIASSDLSGNTLKLSALKTGTAEVTITSEYANQILTQTFRLIITEPANRSPIASPVPVQHLLNNGSVQTVELSDYVVDPDQDQLAFAIDDLSYDHQVVQAAINNGVLSLTPANVGQTNINIAVKDIYGAVANVIVPVSVEEIPLTNHDPSISAIPDQTLQIGSGDVLLDLSGYMEDTDNDPLTVTAITYDPGVVQVSVSGAVLTLTPVNAGQTSVSVSVNDGQGGTAATAFGVQVSLGNDKPNEKPVLIGGIGEQILTPGYSSEHVTELNQIFRDPDGDALTFSLGNTSEYVNAEIQSSKLILTPGTKAGSSEISIIASDGKGGSTEYHFTVRNAPLVANGRVAIHTKTGVQNVSYDLWNLFANENSFKLYTGSPTKTFSGPQTFNGRTWTIPTEKQTYWVVGADGKAAIFEIDVEQQTAPTLFFSEYLDGGDGRIAFELFRNDAKGSIDLGTGYEIEVHEWMKKTNQQKIVSFPMQKILFNPVIFIDAIFYDVFDLTDITYYNYDDLFLYDPSNFNVTAIVLKKDGKVIDVLGDPNSKEQFLPLGGTIIRKSGVYSGSMAFSQYGEWDTYPKGSYQFLGSHTP
ncbi:S-layer homology domain-containing protein [Paenibacillus dendrobii]|nr:S-layer homology domain-containing protein [Paenibacillus dendrobii]